MKIAISGEVPAKGYSLKELLTIIQELEVSAIEIWPENIDSLVDDASNERSYRNRDVKKAKRLLAEYGIEVACASFGGAFDKKFTNNTNYYIEELICCIGTAAELGAKFVNSYLYYLSTGDLPDYERLANLYRPAIEEAEKHGITLLLENEAHDSTKDPKVMKNIVQKINNKHFRVNFDAINYYQASHECFPYALTELKDCFSYIHIKDGCIYNPEDVTHNPRCKGGIMTGANAGSYIYYPIMGNGVLNIPGEIEALKRLGYEGWCTLEPHVPIDLWKLYITEEVAYLKRLGLE